MGRGRESHLGENIPRRVKKRSDSGKKVSLESVEAVGPGGSP